MNILECSFTRVSCWTVLLKSELEGRLLPPEFPLLMLIIDFVQFLFVFPIPVMELRTIQSDIQEPAPDIVFPNISDPRIRKWTNQTNVISLSPAALDEVAQGANVDAHVCGVLFKTVGDLSIPIEEGQGYVLTYCSML